MPWSAKQPGGFGGGSAVGKGWDFENLEVVEPGDAVVDVLVKQVAEDDAGLRRIPRTSDPALEMLYSVISIPSRAAKHSRSALQFARMPWHFSTIASTSASVLS